MCASKSLVLVFSSFGSTLNISTSLPRVLSKGINLTAVIYECVPGGNACKCEGLSKTGFFGRDKSFTFML